MKDHINFNSAIEMVSSKLDNKLSSDELAMFMMMKIEFLRNSKKCNLNAYCTHKTNDNICSRSLRQCSYQIERDLFNRN